MNMFKIWMKGEIIALLPAEHTAEFMLPNGKRLHVGPDGMYYREAVPEADQIEVSYHEV